MVLFRRRKAEKKVKSREDGLSLPPLRFRMVGRGEAVEMIWPEKRPDPEELPTPEEVILFLEDIGVTTRMEASQIERSLILRESDPYPPEPVRVVSGISVEEGEDGVIEWEAKPGHVVEVDDLICRVLAPRTGRNGLTVKGEEIVAKRGQQVTCLEGKGVESFDSGLGFKSTCSGRVEFEEDSVSVLPILEIDDSFHFAHVSCPPETTGVTEEYLVGLLESEGLTCGFDEESMKEVVKRAGSGEAIEEVAIASWTPPEHGRDGRLELWVPIGLRAGTVDETGQMNFRDRGWAESVVEPGQKIALLFPPEDGVDGEDLRGRAVPAEVGDEVICEVGPGADLSEDGRVFSAKTQGRVTLQSSKGKQVLAVYETLEVDGDVGAETGNVDVGEKAIVVHGSVRSAFLLSAGGPVLVDGTTEDCRVVSRGGFICARGVVHGRHGSIDASGDVSAAFAQNARIRCGGDLTIPGGVVNSNIQVGGNMTVEGAQGRIVGGRISVDGDLVVRNLGSQANVPTRVFLGSSAEKKEQNRVRLREVEQILAPLRARFGREMEPTVFESLSHSDRQLFSRLDAMEAESEALDVPVEESEQGELGTLTVLDSVYPGVTICIGDHYLQIHDALVAVIYQLKGDGSEIEAVSLREKP
ncbi:MAG: FapA family protein [Planctomycetota bacterium]|nr:FapA family protein [Planctomycetota bacterium]